MAKNTEDQSGMKKVAVIGTESSGKTTLCKQITEVLHAIYIPEYAREYIGALNRAYTLNDIIHIDQFQWEKLEITIKEGGYQLALSDTESIINKVWSEDVFSEVPEIIEQHIKSSPFDLYMLLKPDLPWQPDPLRTNQHRREYLHTCYLKELELYSLPFTEISGQGPRRLEAALDAIQNMQQL